MTMYEILYEMLDFLFISFLIVVPISIGYFLGLFHYKKVTTPKVDTILLSNVESKIQTLDQKVSTLLEQRKGE